MLVRNDSPDKTGDSGGHGVWRIRGREFCGFVRAGLVDSAARETSGLRVGEGAKQAGEVVGELLSLFKLTGGSV